jgi:carbon monoxide dehydrogenase subunit G
MTGIIETVEVDRTPEEAFSYVTDPTRFGEWQQGVVGDHMEGDGQPRVGSKCITRRRIGLAERPATAEVTALSPPRAWAVHGIDGPIRASVNVTVDPLDNGARSRVTIAVDFEGHGIGKLLVPLIVRREAQKEMPMNLQRLKQRLDSGT